MVCYEPNQLQKTLEEIAASQGAGVAGESILRNNSDRLAFKLEQLQDIYYQMVESFDEDLKLIKSGFYKWLCSTDEEAKCAEIDYHISHGGFLPSNTMWSYVLTLIGGFNYLRSDLCNHYVSAFETAIKGWDDDPDVQDLFLKFNVEYSKRYKKYIEDLKLLYRNTLDLIINSSKAIPTEY